MFKFCKKCQVETERNTQGNCKPCCKLRSAAWSKANRDKCNAAAAKYKKTYPERGAAYRATNRAKLNAASTAWNKANPERVTAWRKAYHIANRSKINAASTAWRKANPERSTVFAAEYHIANRAKLNAASAAWAAANPKRKAVSAAAWHAANIDDRAMARTAWKRDNPHKLCAYTASRRASKFQRTPKWLSLAQLSLIEEMYLNAKLMGQFDGLKYHVDHIVPLRGKTVSGLHVPWNLQLLTAIENETKSNSTWPDMP